MSPQRDDLFAYLASPEQFLDRVTAFVAPVANQSDATSKDPLALKIAEAVYEAFGDLDGGGGLTRAELAAACARTTPADSFDSRFDLFVAMGLLRRYRGDKPHQQRYVLNPTSVAALLVFERLKEVGGVHEILSLLDRTRQDLAAGTIGRDEVEVRLTRARRGLAIFAAHLEHLVRVRTWEELLTERSHYRNTDQLLPEAEELVAIVAKRFSDLSGVGSRLIGEALRYSSAVNDFCERLLEQASARRDFSMLLPEQYLSAALNSTRDSLARVFEGTVFDPPALVVTPEQVIQAVEQYRPRAQRQRPPRPAAMPPGRDPLDRMRERVKVERSRIAAQTELHLQGDNEVDLTSRIRGAGWRGAARIVADALSAHADTSLAVEVELSQVLIVDPTARVSHVTPMILRRSARPISGTASPVPVEELLSDV